MTATAPAAHSQTSKKAEVSELLYVKNSNAVVIVLEVNL